MAVRHVALPLVGPVDGPNQAQAAALVGWSRRALRGVRRGKSRPAVLSEAVNRADKSEAPGGVEIFNPVERQARRPRKALAMMPARLTSAPIPAPIK